MTVRYLAILSSVAILAVAGWHRTRLESTVPVGDFYESVADVAARIPMRSAFWMGEDIAVPPAAFALLRPNVLMARRYTNITSGQSVQVVLIHCGDARDMFGHWPVNCYPGAGWNLQSRTSVEQPTSFGTVNASDFLFNSNRLDGPTPIRVLGFMMNGSGETFADMDGLRIGSLTSPTRSLGAAQLQIITDAGMSDEVRTSIRSEMLQLYAPAVRAILGGVRANEKSNASGLRAEGSAT